ncbi:NAD(P)H-dependent glycerol-3-phosphate dehydrogenase [Trichothermofontia sp.]
MSTLRSATTVTILGAGAWGLALAELARRAGNRVRLWSRHLGEPLAEAIADADVIVSAVSMAGVTPMATCLHTLSLPPHLILVSATKGLDPATTRTPSQVWQAALPEHPIAVLSGPNLSQEIQQGLPAATVVASRELAIATRVQQVLASPRFRIYTNTDLLGTELGGTLKNVMAIAAGVCDGLHLGTNAKSALLTRALPEMIRIGTRLGAKADTFFGLSGLGDLLATCNSPLSRNYQVGYGLGQGQQLADILANLKGTAEGINTAAVLVTIAEREQITIPVAWEVYRVLQGRVTPQAALEALMERALKPEDPR